VTRQQLAWLVQALLDDLVMAPARIAAAYTDGVAEGIELGIRIGAEQAEREMAEAWARVADQVRETASPRSRTFAGRRAAEIEAAKPRPGDYTGQLSEAEYFGASAAQGQSLERRAA
jgi:hypothetical protein